jgi:hypothetical protein
MRYFMKKIVLSIFAIALISIIGCKKDKYSEARILMNDTISTYESCINGIEKASSGKDIANSLNKFADAMIPIVTKANELNKKYPELKLNTKTPDKELEKEAKKLEETIKRFGSNAITQNMMKYMKDPEVIKAYQNMSEKLSNIK